MGKSMGQVIPSQRSCNRHEDCALAEQKWLKEHSYQEKWQIPYGFHCHDECCEECFGY